MPKKSSINVLFFLNLLFMYYMWD